MKLPIIGSVSALKINVLRTNDDVYVKHYIPNREIISCKPRCNHCCYRKIYVSIGEAVVMMQHLQKKNKLKGVMERSSSTLQIATGTDVDTYYAMKIPCPVLNVQTGLCEAYAVRPPSCSTHFVLSDPEGCNQWSPTRVKYIDFRSEYHLQKYNEMNESKVSPALLLKLPIQKAFEVAEKIKEREFESLDQVLISIAKDAL